MLTFLHQLLANKQPQTPDTASRQGHEHSAQSPKLSSFTSSTMPAERKRTFYSMRQIDMLTKEDLLTTRFPRFWRMQQCLTQIPLGLWAGCTLVLMSCLILMEGCFYYQAEQEQTLTPLNQGRNLLVALQQDQVLLQPQPLLHAQAQSQSQVLSLPPAFLEPEAVPSVANVAATPQLTNATQGNLRRTAFTDSTSAAAAPATSVTGTAIALDPTRSPRDSVFRKASYTEVHNTGLRVTATQHSLGTNAVAHQATLLDLPS